MWRGLDGDRPVAQVAVEWAEGRWVWAGYYWGDLPPTALGVSLGRDPRRVNGVFESAEEAMAAVDQRHDRASS